MSKPAIITTTKPLPFDALEPLEFERMCLWLVGREGYLRSQHLGEAGGEQGRDITAYKVTDAGEELWYFQCKRYKRLGAAALKKEVDKYNKLVASDPTKKPAGIVFVTNAVLSERTRENVGAYCRDCGYAYEFWAHTELDLKVKRHSEIVTEFFYSSYAVADTVLHQLPPPAHDFTGRSDDLAELIAALGRRKTNLISLHGMGGIGKTALALKLADDLMAEYPDAQFYLDLRGAGPEPLSVADVMLHVVRSYDPAARIPVSESELRARYLSALHEQRALLLLDNASGPEQVEPLIPPASCFLLITSRQRFHIPGLLARSVDSLPPEDARTLLLKIAPRLGEQADVVSGLCGYLPLALRHAAGMLSVRTDLGVEDYVRRLRSAQKRLEPVIMPLSLSYESLSPEMQSLWRNLAVFPNLFDAAAAASAWGRELDPAQDALGELFKYSLVEWNEAVARYNLHDLARLFADSRLGEDETSKSRGRHAAHYLNVLRAANQIYGKSAEYPWVGLALFDLEWPNIEAGQSWAESRAGVDDVAATLCSHYPDAGAHLFHLRVHPRQQIRWREAALAAARRLNNRKEEGVHLGNLGVAYAAMGQTRYAVKLHEQALHISRETEDRWSEAHDLSELGMAYLSLGEPQQAVEFLEEGLNICREVGDRHGECLALGNLASIYKNTGSFRRAINYYGEALAIAREVGERRSEGGVLSGLGVLYAELGDVSRAYELHRQALAISRERGDLRGEGGDLGNLGWCLVYAGDLQQALECHRRQLSIARETGELHMEGDALYGLGTVYSKQGDTPLAIKHFEEALKIFSDSGNRLAEERAVGDLGNVYARASKFRRAVECYERQLAIARGVGDRRGEATAIWNTGWSLNQLGDRARAISYAEEALKIYEEIEDSNSVSRVRKFLTEWRMS